MKSKKPKKKHAVTVDRFPKEYSKHSTVTMSIILTENEYLRFRKYSHKQNRNMTDQVRYMIEEAIKYGKKDM